MFSKNVFVIFEHLQSISIPSLIFMLFILSQYIAISLVALPLLQVSGFAHKLTIMGRLS